MTSASIHCNDRIPWQQAFAPKMLAGLMKRGIVAEITGDHGRRDDGFPILLGTTFWRDIESDGGPYLLVDRCSFGDTNRFVTLVWNGHGRRGVHPMPEHPSAARWEKYGIPLKPWQAPGKRIVLCGQTSSYSPNVGYIKDWYDTVAATHFRRHPSGSNPTNLPEALDFTDAVAVTLNSSIGVQTVIDGIPTITQDEGSMAWGVTGHALDDIQTPDRMPWLTWLAWTQWSHDEIEAGLPWDYILE